MNSGEKLSGQDLRPSSMIALIAFLCLQDLGDWVERLGDDRPAERDRAQAQILALGKPAVDSLRRHLDRATDEEIKARLRQIIEQLTTVRWTLSVESAMALAKKWKKPILVFCGPQEVWPAGKQMLKTFSDPRVVDRVNAEFVPLRHVNAYSQPAPEGAVEGSEGTSDYRSAVFLCNPDGKIVHFVSGWLGPEAFLDQLDAALALGKADSPENLLKLHEQFIEKNNRSSAPIGRRLAAMHQEATGYLMRDLAPVLDNWGVFRERG